METLNFPSFFVGNSKLFVETPNFALLTASFVLETPNSRWKPQIFPDVLLETPNYFWKPQISQFSIGNPKFPKISIGNPKFSLGKQKLSMETPIFPFQRPNYPRKPEIFLLFLLETPNYLWQHQISQIFYRKHQFSQNFDWKPQIFPWKPHILHGNPNFSQIVYWKLQIISGNPKFSIGNPNFSLGNLKFLLETPNF